jgi:hypothetical protein
VVADVVRARGVGLVVILCLLGLRCQPLLGSCCSLVVHALHSRLRVRHLLVPLSATRGELADIRIVACQSLLRC